MEQQVSAIIKAVYTKGGARLAYVLRNALSDSLTHRVSKWHPDPKDPEVTVRKRLSDNRKIGFVYLREDSSGTQHFMPDLIGNKGAMTACITRRDAEDLVDKRLRELGYQIG